MEQDAGFTVRPKRPGRLISLVRLGDYCSNWGNGSKTFKSRKILASNLGSTIKDQFLSSLVLVKAGYPTEKFSEAQGIKLRSNR
jgi:hypothetical protein